MSIEKEFLAEESGVDYDEVVSDDLANLTEDDFKTTSGFCPQCEFEEETDLFDGVCSHCDGLNRKWDYENSLCNGVSDIPFTKENLHSYYEFFSNEDLEKHSSLINDVLDERLFLIRTTLNIGVVDLSFNIINTFANKYKVESISKITFGVKDTLKPIEEYIQEIKESEAYKNYIATK